MIKHLNNFFKRIFNNEETVIFALIIIFTLIIFSFFAAILTPFIVSIVAAYLLVGLQKKIESYNVSETIAKILSFSIFIIIGAVMVIWLIPLLYGQLTKFIGDIPGFYAAFMKYVAEKSASFPALVESGQLQVILQSVSQELSSITPNLVNSSISGIQSSLSMLEILIHHDRGFSQAIKIARKGIKDHDEAIQEKSIRLFMALIRKNQALNLEKLHMKP